MKHTPGPWEAIETKPIAGVTVARGWFVSPVKSKRPTLDIAQVHLTSSQNRAEQAANAQLIAAAPELLEACKKGLECAEALNTLGSFVGSSQQQKTVDAIKATIAKAEGQANG